MAACGSFQHIFDTPLPENPTLLDSLSSWKPIQSVQPIDQPSFTEIFGELHFKDASHSSSSLPLPSIKSPFSDSFSTTPKDTYSANHNKSDSFSSMNSESLQLCTEGLGFESSGDVEESENDTNGDGQNSGVAKYSPLDSPPLDSPGNEYRRSKTSKGAFPPPISCIGKSGKPWFCFKSYRQDGRFVLKQIRIPTQEFLHAYREDGRLKLHFVLPSDEVLEEEEVEEVEDDIEEINENRGRYEDDAHNKQEEA